MAGLFEKDMRLLLKRKQVLIIFLTMALIMSISMDGMFLVSYLTFLGSIYTISTISYDELDNGFTFLMTLPIDAKVYVIEKYCFSVFFGVIAWGVGVLFLVVGNLVKGMSVGNLEYLEEGALLLPCLLIILSIMIPMQLKFGVEKSRIAFAVLAGGIVGLAYLGKKVIEWSSFNTPAFLVKFEQMSYAGVLAVFCIVAIVCTVISVLCGIRIMERKEY